jgi:large subunit ribosomal protein L15e
MKAEKNVLIGFELTILALGNITTEATTMGLYQHIRNLWKTPKKTMPELWKQRLIEWRKQPSTMRIERPTRLDRARSLGYKAKKGFIIVRQRIPRGGKQREHFMGGRNPKKMRRKKVLDISYKTLAERRAAEKFRSNCEVLNSYWVAKDGLYYWYEVILLDKTSPVIKKDPRLNWILDKRGRADRGLTSSARKSRGLRHKGRGAEKLRPSRAASFRKKVRKQRRP